MELQNFRAGNEMISHTPRMAHELSFPLQHQKWTLLSIIALFPVFRFGLRILLNTALQAAMLNASDGRQINICHKNVAQRPDLADEEIGQRKEVTCSKPCDQSVDLR